MTQELNELIEQYRKAQKHMIVVQNDDQAKFDAALAICRELRREINRLCPESETYNPMEGNVVARV